MKSLKDILAVVVGILAAIGAIYYFYRFVTHPDVVGGGHTEGWIALGLGTFFSLLVGCGLMALMFFSSRSGHDDAADPFRNKKEPPAE